MKKIWITSLIKDRGIIGHVLQIAKDYSLAPNGHFWIDDLKKMAWLPPLEEITSPDNAIWVIVGNREHLTPEVAYGLSLLCIGTQAKKGIGFPIIWLTTDKDFTSAVLPTPIKAAEILPLYSPTLGAKLVARANTPYSPPDMEYRLDVHANPAIGVWFEVGPSRDEWHGAMMGVSGGGIESHGVGKSGKPPHTSVLNYPMRGLEIELGEEKYLAWAVQNPIDKDTSYYVKVTDLPRGILFGPFAQEDTAEVHTLKFSYT